MFRLMLDLLGELDSKVAGLDKKIAMRAREDAISRRLMTLPGIGAITDTAIAALAPPAETFTKGRDFAAWLGLTPLQKATDVDQGIRGEQVAAAMTRITESRGAPRTIPVDNGPEFISKALDRWATGTASRSTSVGPANRRTMRS
jgi:hypothetical protein